MYKYRIKLILEKNKDVEMLIDSLKEISEDLRIDNSLDGDFLLSLISPFPTQIFDLCAQFGRLKSVKIEEQ
ncbi:MAG: hypothetical protein N2Z79_00725 [Candidatus Omnitrophica bacterium]|nr:hypothetical protein [Candidatus Omnitrophota bacterium]